MQSLNNLHPEAKINCYEKAYHTHCPCVVHIFQCTNEEKPRK